MQYMFSNPNYILAMFDEAEQAIATNDWEWYERCMRESYESICPYDQEKYSDLLALLDAELDRISDELAKRTAISEPPTLASDFAALKASVATIIQAHLTPLQK